MKLALIIALLLTASPVAAQVTTNEQQPGQTTSSTSSTSIPGTGAICEEEMTATFCNGPAAPNNAGYGGASAPSTSTGSATPSPSIPTCFELGPANELCN